MDKGQFSGFMDIKFKEYIRLILTDFKSFLNKNTVRNIFYVVSSIVLFIAGVIVYGIILNLREVPLSEAMHEKGFTELNNVNIVIEKSAYSLLLYDDSTLIKTYRANFGKNIRAPKLFKDDNATPTGVYRICSIDTNSIYHKFFKINYPNLDDATAAFRKGLIDQTQFDNLKFQYYYGDCSDSTTILGGNIGIEGIGKYNDIFKNLPFVYNWTNGSIALSNEDIDELYTVIKKGTKVVIK
jgi:murein L,D-transpeptidase YafK